MQRILYFIVIVLFISGCSKVKKEMEIVVETFPIEDSLPGSRINLADAEYLSNMAFCAGDYLVFRAIRDNYFLQIYDRNFNLVGKILNKGEGPEELPDATWSGQWTGNPSNPEITVFCSPKKRLASLRIHPFAGLNTMCDIPVSENIDPTMVYQTSDSTLMGITLSMDSGASLFSYNTTTQMVKRAESPFEFADGPMIFYTSQQTMDYSPRSKEICCAYMSFPAMVIYDYDFKMLRKIHIGEKVNTATLSYSDKYPRLSNVKYYKEFILVMLTDAETNESRLLVFDSDGEPRASYAIGHAIWYVIDENAQRILSVKYDTAEDVVYLDSHNMPETLTN